MATLKQIRRRIRSVQNTRQITKAMEMVAAAKLRKAQARAEAARPYARAMESVLEHLSAAARSLSHPLFEERALRRLLLFVVGADKGLCGSFNANVIRFAEASISEVGRGSVILVPVGKRIYEYFAHRKWDLPYGLVPMGDQVTLELTERIARIAREVFLRGDVDRVDFVYTRFVTTAKRLVERVTVVPVARGAAGEDEIPADYIYEPDPEVIFQTLLPRYVGTRVMSILADSFASEHSARMLAMGNATQNAEQMIASLTLTANKLRQAAITKELLEIVGGAAATA